MNDNRLVLAVAGSGKTQTIADACAHGASGARILVLTYTTRNQRELERRISSRSPMAATVEVMGWFTFLLRQMIRPYLPRVFPGERLRGFNFEGDPGRYASGRARFLDNEGRAFKLHTAQFALMTNDASQGGAIDRLAQIYDELYIDEVQDCNGWDLEILDLLLASPIRVTLVGDVKQAILQTNVRDQKNKQYRGPDIKRWFDVREKKGTLVVEQINVTYRCNSAVAAFADGLFDQAYEFHATVSKNHEQTDHDGVFVVSKRNCRAYYEAFSACCLRATVRSNADIDLPFTNIGLIKGATTDHVLIGPTAKVLAFIVDGTALDQAAACSLYVAATRARASVAFIVPDPTKIHLQEWTP